MTIKCTEVGHCYNPDELSPRTCGRCQHIEREDETMTKDMPELKPCPFCGGEAERYTCNDPEDQINFGGDVVGCKSCNASTCIVFGEKEGLEDRWNARANTPTSEAREKALDEDANMADIGRAFMQALRNMPDGWRPCDCPSEAISDLLNEIAELKRAALQQPDTTEAVRVLVGALEHTKSFIEMMPKGIGRGAAGPLYQNVTTALDHPAVIAAMKG